MQFPQQLWNERYYWRTNYAANRRKRGYTPKWQNVNNKCIHYDGDEAL